MNNQEFNQNEIGRPLDMMKLDKNPEEEQKQGKPAGQHERMEIHSINEPVFALKIQKSCTNELPKVSAFGFLGLKLRQSVVGLSEEEADQCMRIDQTNSELSNDDVILCEPRSLVKKTWRMKNLGTRQWPADTRLVSVTDDLYYEGPRIAIQLKPGEMMDISVKIYVPENINGDNNMKEYILRLY